MSSQPSQSRLKNLVVTLMFASFVSLPMIGQWLGFSDLEAIRRQEYRDPASLPQQDLLYRDLPEYTSQMDAYLNDHFGFRSNLVELNRSIPVATRPPNTRVVVGKDGWLFFTDSEVVDNCRGIHPFSTAELERWFQVIGERDEWLRQREIPMAVAIAPVKHTVYRRYLPGWATQLGPSRFDQIVTRAGVAGSPTIIDLRSAFFKADKRQPDRLLYYKQDSHWNEFGAFVAYLEMMERLEGSVAGLVPLRPSEVEFKLLPAQVADLARIASLEKNESQQYAHTTLASSSAVVSAQFLKDGQWRDVSEEERWRDIPFISRLTTHATDRPRLYLIRDSYSHALDHYLQTHVRTDHVRSPHGRSQSRTG